MLKRMLDIVVSGIVLLILAAPFLVIMVVLRCTGEGEVWYLQERVGRDGRIFRVFKFATMLRDSPQMGSKDITVKNDPRVLPVGRFLRKTKINELPQFINVFRGDMSLVGWRPLMPMSFEAYADDVKKQIVKVQPGLTGIGSIVFRDEESIVTQAKREGRDLRETYRDEIMPYKGALELWYADHAGLWTDLKILLATAIAVIVPGWTGYRRWFSDLPRPHSRFLAERLKLDDSDG